MRYEGANGNPHTSDYGSELRGIAALRAAGLGDVELHGHTHIHPDVSAWLRAPDRHDEIGWYREFGRPAAAAIAERGAGRHPLELGLAALRRIFGVRPTTFVPPGDRFHDADVETALRLGFSFVESYYLAIRDGDRFLWCQHVCAPYLDLASPDWLAAGLPVVGYFHDNDVAAGGVEWVRRHLDAWADAGVERMIDFRELAAALALDLDLREREGRPVLTVTSARRRAAAGTAGARAARRSRRRRGDRRGDRRRPGREAARRVAATATSARRSRRGPEPMTREVCLFLHIPKTAGTTLKTCIYDEYAVEAGHDGRWLHDGIYYFPYGFHKAKRPRFTRGGARGAGPGGPPGRRRPLLVRRTPPRAATVRATSRFSATRSSASSPSTTTSSRRRASSCTRRSSRARRAWRSS